MNPHTRTQTNNKTLLEISTLLSCLISLLLNIILDSKLLIPEGIRISQSSDPKGIRIGPDSISIRVKFLAFNLKRRIGLHKHPGGIANATSSRHVCAHYFGGAQTLSALLRAQMSANFYRLKHSNVEVRLGCGCASTLPRAARSRLLR